MESLVKLIFKLSTPCCSICKMNLCNFYFFAVVAKSYKAKFHIKASQGYSAP
ncbi:hypothetical protein [Tissierella sp.]|uniref:hypothetical protein n=1 Tax=Tissierella sp. TaxID=41274 RepID=UPI0028AE6055|nr:hypothetical protein [Tissierella sp.]